MNAVSVVIIRISLNLLSAEVVTRREPEPRRDRQLKQLDGLHQVVFYFDHSRVCSSEGSWLV